MCYKVNFDPGFEYLGLIFAAEVDEAKNAALAALFYMT